jgi:ATP-dependent helicase HrpA
VDQGASASLRLLDTAEAAAAAMRGGLRRLFALQAKNELDYHVRISPSLQQMALHYATLGKPEELKRDLRDLVAQRAFIDGYEPAIVCTKPAFDQRLVAGTKKIGPIAREVTMLVAQVLALHHAIALRLSDRMPAAWAPAAADIRAQLGLLMPKGFLLSVPWERLSHYGRYLSAIQVRLNRLQNAGLPRDQRAMQELAVPWNRYLQRVSAAPSPTSPPPPMHNGPLSNYRWMLEEYRVSLFAQELGTAQPVSAKRLDEQWAKVVE